MPQRYWRPQQRRKFLRRAHSQRYADVMPGAWTNRCGGRSWRTLPDWRIEVQGSGFPSWTPGEPSFRLLANSWENWAPLIRKAASKHGLPASWILAFINAETGHKSADPTVQASCGPWSTKCRNSCCAGLMQVMVQPYPNYRTFGGYTRPEDMLDPWKAIDTGSAMLARMVERADWELPAMASSYNQGPGSGAVHCPGGKAHACSLSYWAMCSDPGYISRVVSGNNAAIEHLGVNEASLPLWAYVAAGGAVALATIVLLQRH